MTMPIINGNGVLTNVFALGDGSAVDPYRHAPMRYQDALADLGKLFVYSERQALANGVAIDHMLSIPAGVHAELLSFEIGTTSAPLEVDIFEGTLVSANGTQHPVYNMNRQSASVPKVLMYEAPTVTSDGTTMIQTLVFGVKANGGVAGMEGRLILKPAEKYLLRIRNVSGGNASIAVNIVFGED